MGQPVDTQLSEDQKRVAREMSQRACAAMYAGRQRGTPLGRRGRSRATLRGRATRQRRGRRRFYSAPLH
eukprot:9063434-Pyramimonas_sp.AAC.1